MTASARFPLLLALLASGSAAHGAANVTETPLVRSVYATAIPEDSKRLWDIVDDLRQLNRAEDSQLLDWYVQRSIMESIVGEQPRSAATLRELLDQERTAPGLGPNLVSRVLALASGTLDTSSDDSVMPSVNVSRSYRYKGDSVWEIEDQPERGFLRLAILNSSHRDILGPTSTARITMPGNEIAMQCEGYARRSSAVVHDGESAIALCDAGRASSTPRTNIRTPELIELVRQIGDGRASLEIKVNSICFPKDELCVGSGQLWRYAHQRTFPQLFNVTCEDRNTCAKEHKEATQKQIDSLIFNPVTFCLVLCLIGVGIGYLFLKLIFRATGRFGGQAPARLTVLGLAATAFVGAASAWRWMQSLSGWGPLLAIFVIMGCTALGLGLLIAAAFPLAARSRTDSQDPGETV